MATLEQVDQLRRYADYFATDPYDDTQLSALIDGSSVFRVAARLWDEKAASQTSLVDISESGSSRKMSDSHKNAINMAKYFRGLADAEEAPTAEANTRHARTRAIVREG